MGQGQPAFGIGCLFPLRSGRPLGARLSRSPWQPRQTAFLSSLWFSLTFQISPQAVPPEEVAAISLSEEVAAISLSEEVAAIQEVRFSFAAQARKVGHPQPPQALQISQGQEESLALSRQETR